MIYFPSQPIESIKNWLIGNPPITIVTHFNPDGDAIGSSLALKLFYEQLGFHVDCIFPSDFPKYNHWIPRIEEAKIFSEKYRQEFINYFHEDRIVFCLDFNHSSRVHMMSDILANSKAKKIMIDHHEEPSDEFDISFSFPGRSSTCELVYDFIKSYGVGNLNLEMATCLYVGLLTDTGGFQFSSTHSSTHHMAAELISIGVKPNEIFNLTFNNFSLDRLKLFGHCIAHSMKVVEDKRLAYLWIDFNTKKEFNIQDGDTEGLVNYPLKVLDIDVSVLFKQDYDKIRISFRSKNQVDVSQISKQYFNGGGHKNAAGGMSKLSLSKTISYFESLIPTIF